jgi:hypothetical protein
LGKQSLVFKLEFPEVTDPGKFLLIVSRASSSMFAGGTPAVFAIDNLHCDMDNSGRAISWIGVFPDSTRIVFPTGTPFLLIPRARVTTMTAVEAAKASQEEEKEMASLLEAVEFPEGKSLEADDFPAGKNTYL